MSSFASFFKASQMSEWRNWYLNLDGLRATSLAMTSRQVPSSAATVDSSHSSFSNGPDPDAVVGISDMHRSALDRLKSRGTNVRVGCDLWFDAPAEPVVRNGDHLIGVPRDRSNVNVLLFPRNARVKLRHDPKTNIPTPFAPSPAPGPARPKVAVDPIELSILASPPRSPRRVIAGVEPPRSAIALEQQPFCEVAPPTPTNQRDFLLDSPMRGEKRIFSLPPTAVNDPFRSPLMPPSRSGMRTPLRRDRANSLILPAPAMVGIPPSLARHGVEVSIALLPRMSNGCAVDLNALEQKVFSGGDTAAMQPSDQSAEVMLRAETFDVAPVLTTQGHVILRTSTSRHGLWVAMADPKQYIDVDPTLLPSFAVTLGLDDVLEDLDLLADVYAALSGTWSRELRKVSKFYSRQAELVASSVAACVETSKTASRQTARERHKFTLAFRDTFAALDTLQQFRELNSVAVFRAFDHLERLTGHDIMSSLGRQLRRVSFMAKDAEGQSALAVLRELLLKATIPFCPPSMHLNDFINTGNDGTEEYRLRQAGYNTAIGTLLGICLTLLLATAVDFMEESQPLIVNNDGGALASYHFIITLGIIMLYGVFAGVVEACEHMSVNFVFLFELDSSDHWTGRELLRNVMVYLTLWLACLYGFMRTAKAEFRGDVNSGWAWVWSYIVWGCMIVTWIAYQVLHPSTRKRWFLDTLWHVVTAPWYPVRFRDFVIGLIFMSSAEILNQFQLIWCNVQIPGMGWDCSVASSSKLFVLAALPPIWRTLQCCRSYMAPLPHRRTAFPHLVNAGKYVTGMVAAALGMGYKLQGRFNPDDDQGYNALLYTYVVVSIFNTIYRFLWDFFVNGAFIPAANIVEIDRRRYDRMADLFGTDRVHVGSEGYPELAITSTRSHLEDADEDDDDEDGRARRPLPRSWSFVAVDHHHHHQHHDAVHLDDHHAFVCGWTWWPIRRTHLPPWKYVAAYSYNAIARSWFVFSLLYTTPSLWVPLLSMFVESLRRLCILCVRLEAEQVSNVENFKLTGAAPPALRGGAGKAERGLLSTTAWDGAAGELALGLDKIPSEQILVNDSQVDRFFSLLPVPEKVAVMQLTVSFIPSARSFDGHVGEGKARWFAERPPDVKVLALLQRAGSRSLSQYAHDCTASKL